MARVEQVVDAPVGVKIRVPSNRPVGHQQAVEVLVHAACREHLDRQVQLVAIERRPGVVYRAEKLGYGPTGVTLNGTPLPCEREVNPYRTGGVVVSMAAVEGILGEVVNVLQVQLG
jgi:hypothetical protein